MEAQQFLQALLNVGLTQAAIAAETGIPQPTLSRLARGQTKDLPSRRSRKLEALWELRVAGQTARTSQQLEVPHLRAGTEAKAA